MKLKSGLIAVFIVVILIPITLVLAQSFMASTNEQRDTMIIATFIFVTTTFILLMWIYYSIVRPLHMLEEATKQIKEGNLNFTLEIDGSDEISQLCMDFEEMRIRLKENEEEKIQADKDSKELISNISHDLKTPITAIKGYVEGIMDGVASSEEKLDKYIRTIYNKANDMDKLIDELTFYARIDTNKVPYSFNKICIVNFFRDCADEWGLELDARNIGFTFTSHLQSESLVIADVEQMKRVVNNIISNSVKYMDKAKSEISIDLYDEGDFIKIDLGDNGRGIAAADLPLVFERFYRTDSSRNSLQGGSGIGLSIVKKIIEDHGGRIWAKSAEGIGTHIMIVLRKHQEVNTNEENTYCGR